jgi:hypothetical protein
MVSDGRAAVPDEASYVPLRDIPPVFDLERVREQPILRDPAINRVLMFLEECGEIFDGLELSHMTSLKGEEARRR